MQQNRIVCIDMGSATIKVAVGVKNSDKIELLATTSVAVEGVIRGGITNIEKCTQAFKKAFDAVRVQPDDYIVVGLGNYYVETTKSEQYKYIDEKAVIEQKHLDELYDKAVDAYLQEGLEKLDVFLRYYNADDIQKIQNPLDMRGVVKLEGVYSILSCRKGLLQNIRQCIKELGFEVSEFVFSSYYAKHIVFGADEKQAGVLVLDIGEDITRASIFVENALYTSFATPFGASNLTLDIKNSYPVTLEQAQQLREQFSSALVELAEENSEVVFEATNGWGTDDYSLKVKDLSAVVQCRLDEIFRGVRYQLDKMGLDDLIESIILTGGGSQQNHMEAYIEKNFRTPAKIGTYKSGLYANINKEEYPAWAYANVLGMLQLGLEDIGVEEREDKPNFVSRMFGVFKKSFIGKPKSDDAKM